jgi:O-antigen/teichoic acid export membrane protein
MCPLPLSSIKPTTRVARGATYMFIQGFASAAIGLIYFVILARILTQEEMGVYALLLFILSLPQLFGLFSLPSAATKYIPQYLAEGNYDKAKSVVTRILQISLLVSIVFFLLLFLPAEWISIQFFNKPAYVLHLRVVALSSVFNILYMVTAGFLQGLQKIRDYAALTLIYSLIQYSLSIVLISIGWGLYGVVCGWLAGLSIASIAGLFLTIRELGIREKPHELKPLFKFSLPLYFSGIIGYFINWADQLILVSYMSLLYGAEEAQRILGVYYVAIRASAVPTLFSSAIITALFPQLSALYAQQGANSLKDAFHVSSRYAVLIGFPLIIGVAVLAYPIIVLFAGSDYSEAALPLIIISFGSLVVALGIAIGPILLTLERTLIISLTAVISVILSVLFSVFALVILGLGMMGTAWARTLASIIGLGLNLYVLNHYIKVSFDKEALWKATASAVFMVFAIIIADLLRGVLETLLSSSSYQFLVFRLHLLPVYVVIGAIAYFSFLLLLKAIKKHDIELLQEYLPKGFRRVASFLELIARVK